MLGYLRKRQTAGVEHVDGARYVRTVELNGDVGLVTVWNDATRNRLAVRIDDSLASHIPIIERRLRRMFDLDADVEAIRTVLSSDPGLKPLCDAYPGIRVPGAWSAFELLMRTIVGQQVSVGAATTVMGRIVARTGRPLASAGRAESLASAGRAESPASAGRAVSPASAGRAESLAAGNETREPAGATPHNCTAHHTPTLLFPTPEAIATADLDGIGLPGRRAAALQNIARLIAAGHLPFSSDGADVIVGNRNTDDPGSAGRIADGVAHGIAHGIADGVAHGIAPGAALDEFKATLLALPGIGPWTVAYFSLRALRDTDAWPGTDLILRRALDQHPLAGERSARAISDGWRPYRAYAAVHLWHAATRDV